MKPTTVFIVILLMLALAGCGASSSGEDSPAANALESYLQALVAKDEAALVNQVCADKEMDALLELDAFQGVETTLEGLSCAESGSQDGATLVSCQGKIIASYASEQQQFDLAKRTYRVISQDGNLLVCGYEMGK